MIFHILVHVTFFLIRIKPFFGLKEADLDPLLKYSTSEIRERLVDKYRISDYAMMVRSTIHEISKIVSNSRTKHLLIFTDLKISKS